MAGVVATRKRPKKQKNKVRFSQREKKKKKKFPPKLVLKKEREKKKLGCVGRLFAVFTKRK